MKLNLQNGTIDKLYKHCIICSAHDYKSTHMKIMSSGT